ncbi:hypothetical protein MNB_SM-4-539 [hydrothermal vent metagenome]|uniref:Cadherin-like beta sandwich domain-containing protein n=1 Tax=hydrothermal vent metagenome TaxID=652676 RepID=A0A1W1BD58_9ZZZZ
MTIKSILYLSLLAVTFTSCGSDSTSDNSKLEQSQALALDFVTSAKSTFELTVGENRSFSIQTKGQVSNYALKDAEKWIKIDTKGKLLVNASDVNPGHYPFRVEISDDNKQTISQTYTVDVFETIETLNKMNVYTMNALVFSEIKDPIVSVSSYSVTPVPNSDGTWDFLKTYFKEYWYNYETVIADQGTGEIKSVKTVGKQKEFVISPYGSVIAPNGKLYVSNFMRPDLNIYVSIYNPDTNSFEEDLHTSRFMQGERAPISLGTNGKIYVGCSYKDYQRDADGNYLDSSRHASAFEIDPQTNLITEYAKIGPSHAPDGSVWGYSVAADDTYVYVASGKIPWYLVAYNRETQESKILFTTTKVDGAISVTQYKYGVAAYITGNIDGEDGFYWLDNGSYKKGVVAQALRFDDCPWNPQDVDPFTTYKDIDLAKPPKLDDFAASSGGAQNRLYYKSDEQWEHIDYSVDVHAKELKNMLKMPDGNWLIAGREYSGYSLYNPKDKTVKSLGKIGLSGSLAMSVSGDKVYISGYSNSATYEYNPSQPWTQNNSQKYDPVVGEVDFKDPSLNPRFLGYFSDKSGVHKPYNSAVAKDGKIYYVGRWYRNGNGGGLSWYDPKTDTYDGYYELFSNYQLRHITSVMDGQYMLISGTGVKDSTLGKPTPTKGRLFLLDTITNKIVKTYDPISQSMSGGDIIDLGNGFVMGMTNEGVDSKYESTYFYKMDVMSGEIIWKRIVNLDTMFGTLGNMTYGYGFKKADDGSVYVLLYRKGLTRITQDGHFEQMGALSTYGEIYLDGKDFYLLNKESIEFYKDGLVKN